ncbi:Serine/threonine-protein kinase PknB [Planctomycetes bacterium Pan216]|uniref:Serine/threonine-protein kinase PknB n=1 Tax=Kolteria novifilia TaxID=2527975 RepID=A0A518B818_9BACT|nr:Serine/threonine-protein kinase PknB [Planctomycetes bacterium Pan216]
MSSNNKRLMHVHEFLDLVVKSHVVDEKVLEDALLAAPEVVGGTLEQVARWLISKRFLTPFQIKTIRQRNVRGLVIDGYIILDYLGKGGTGVVYLARSPKGDLQALKVLPISKQTSERTILRFRREIALSQFLSHPGIAAAYEAGETKHVHYLAMEYARGDTLYRLIRRTGPASPIEACRWISQVAGALHYAHQMGVIHRDLKPSNVIIGPKGRTKLLDLGLARWIKDDENEDRVVGVRRIVGSFDYIAPEQAADSSMADARSDVYGLGCLLYFSLSGKPPFHHVKERKAKIAHHRRIHAEPLTHQRSEVPGGLDRDISCMLAKDPSDRFGSAGEVRAVLLEWIDALERGQTEGEAGIPEAEPDFWDLDHMLEMEEELPSDLDSPDEPIPLDEDGMPT